MTDTITVTVRGGAFCAPPGEPGTSSTGRNMVCGASPGGRNRWQATDDVTTAGLAHTPRATRRKLLAEARALDLKIPRRTPDEEVQRLINAARQQKQEQPTATAPAEPFYSPAAGDAGELNGDTTGGAPQPAKPAALAPVSGAYSDREPIHNKWAEFPREEDPVHFHTDGPVGRALKDMGPDSRLDVDGEPLADHMGKLATDVVAGRDSAAHAVQRMKTLRDRLPDGSAAKRAVAFALMDMDVPMTPLPVLPAGTPQPVVDLMAKLHAVPITRGYDDKELGPLKDIAQRYAAGGIGRRQLASDVSHLENRRHESLGDCGKSEIDRAVRAAVQQLRALAS